MTDEKTITQRKAEQEDAKRTIKREKQKTDKQRIYRENNLYRGIKRQE